MAESKVRPIETINGNEVREATKALNDSGLLGDSPLRVVGKKKEVMVQDFLASVDKLAADGKEGDLPDSVVDFYNFLYSEPEEKPPEEKPAKPAGEKKKGPPPGKRSLKFASMDELTAFLKDPPSNTNQVDALLLEGGKCSEIVAKHKANGGTGFANVSTLKAHAKYRETKSGWKFEQSGDEKDPHLKIVGVSA